MRDVENVIKRIIQKTPFRKLLMLSMISLIFLIIVSFSIIVTDLSESKIRDNVRDNMSIVLQTIDTNMDNFLTNVYEGFLNLESNQSLLQLRNPENLDKQISLRAIHYITLQDSMTQFMEANSVAVNNVYVNFADGYVRGEVYEQDPLQINYSYDSWREFFPENKYYWINADSCRELLPDKSVGGALFRIYDESEISGRGIILITIKKDFLEEMLDISEISSVAYIHVITEGETFDYNQKCEALHLYNNQQYLYENAQSVSTDGIVTEVKDDFFFVYKKMKLTNWIIAYSVEESEISNSHYIIKEITTLAVVGILIAYVLVMTYSHIMSRSLRKLTDIVERDDILEHEISIKAYSEITLLSSGLERMRKRINLLLEQVRQEQIMKQRTEIALLQEQINPHFLYNTLFSIMQLCEMNRTKQATQMVKALSNFYRLGLSKGDSIVSVENEFKQVENYLEIQHFRYADKFEYSIECDSEVAECRIPKMSLQPLVENAIYYGIKKRREIGYICIICGTNDGKNAYIEVHDDGPGFTEKRLEEMRKRLKDPSGGIGESFGLKNVDTRIKYEFGEEYGIQIESNPHDTCVRINLKMEKYKEGVQSETTI